MEAPAVILEEDDVEDDTGIQAAPAVPPAIILEEDDVEDDTGIQAAPAVPMEGDVESGTVIQAAVPVEGEGDVEGDAGTQETVQLTFVPVACEQVTHGEETVYVVVDGDGSVMDTYDISGTDFDLQNPKIEDLKPREKTDELVPLVTWACSNCTKAFGPGCEPTKTFMEQKQERNAEGVLVTTAQEEDVSVFLNYIFQWRLFGVTFQTETGQQMLLESINTALCKECAESGLRLYRSLKAFNRMTHDNSKVGQLASNLLHGIRDLATFKADAQKDVPAKPNTPPRDPLPSPPPLIKPKTKFVRYVPPPSSFPPSIYTAADFEVTPVVEQRSAEVEVDPVPSTSAFNGKPAKRGLKRKAMGPDLPNMFACGMCSGTFRRKHNMSRHMLLKHGVGEGRNKNFRCEDCNKTFHFQYLLTSHRQIHTEIRTHQCLKCPMAFKARDGLLHHIRDVHREETTMPRCRLCRKMFKQERSLQEHIWLIHQFGKRMDQPVFNCTTPTCNAKFKRKRSMLAHVRKGQCNSKRVIAKAIKEGETTTLVMARDLSSKKVLLPRRTETGDYPCPLNCGKRFARKSSMRSHAQYLCKFKPKEEVEFEEDIEHDARDDEVGNLAFQQI